MVNREPILRVDALSKTYHLEKAKDLQVKALANVSFDLFDSEFVCVVGESGSGKSTLLHCLGSFEEPDTQCMDSVRYRSLEGTYISIWRNIGWYRQNFVGAVFQSFHLLSTFHVWENVEIPLLLSKSTQWEPDRERRKERVRATLDRVGIEDKWHSRIGEISGGQCQRAAIARALVKHPQIILADEPTGNLDEKTTRMIVQELRQLRNDGVAVLMVTHNLKIAEGYADRIITLRDGRVESDQPVHLWSPATVAIQKDSANGKRDTRSVPTSQIASEPCESIVEQCVGGSDQLQQSVPSEEMHAADCPPEDLTPFNGSARPDIPIGPPIPFDGGRQLTRGFANSVLTGLSRMHGFWRRIVSLLRRLRLPGSELRLPHLLRFALRDARESYTSLFTNIMAILFGTVLSAMLLGLVFGSKEIMRTVIGKIPNIESVNVWVDYSTGAEPMTQSDVDALGKKPGVATVIPEVKQLVYMYATDPKDYLACIAGTQPGDPEVQRLTFTAGSGTVNPDGWDVILTEQVATELSYFDPHGLVGKTITMEMRRYGDLRSPEETKPTLVLKYPLNVVGIVKFSPGNRLYASMNLVRFARDFSTVRSKYIPDVGQKIDGNRISERSLYEGLKLHYANAQEAERRFLELRKDIGSRYEVNWSGQEFLWLRDVQRIAFLVFVGFGLLTVVSGSISVFNTLQASVMRKIREIGILRSLGVSRIDVFSIFVMQSLIIGVLAAIGGLVLTLLAIPFVNRMVDLLAREQWKLEIDLSTLLVLQGSTALLILITVSIVCMAAAFYPSWRAGRITPMDAIRASGQ